MGLLSQEKKWLWRELCPPTSHLMGSVRNLTAMPPLRGTYWKDRRQPTQDATRKVMIEHREKEVSHQVLSGSGTDASETVHPQRY